MTELALAVPEELVEAIAERAAAILEARIQKEPPFLTVEEAAVYLGCGRDTKGPRKGKVKRQRVYDLLSAGRLTRHKDGARVLVARAELDAYLLPPSPRGRSGNGLAR